MGKRYFNRRLAFVLVIFLLVAIVTVISMRQWQQNRLTYAARKAGLNAFKQNDWEHAAINLGRYLTVNPEDVTMLFHYAQAQLNIRPLKTENMQMAITAYRKILRINKNNSQASGKLVSLYLQLNIPTEAELIAQRSLKQTDDPQIRILLAMALAKQRKFDQASIELQNVIKHYPDHILAYEILGKLAEQYPDYFPANGQYWFDEAVKNNPSSAQAFIARGAFNSRNKDLNQTLQDFEKAETLDISDVNTHLSLASELIKIDMFDKAKSHLLAVQSENSTNQRLWQIWAELALKMMSSNEMFNVARTGLKQLANSPWDFMPLAAELYINCGEFDSANDCLNKLKSKNASPATIAFLEALLAKAKKQDYQTIILCKKAQKLGDKSLRTSQMLINTYLQAGDMQTAILELRKMVLDDPSQFSGHFELAKLLIQTGNWSEAAEQANLAVQIEPDNVAAALLCIKTKILLIQNNSTNAEFEYKKLENLLADLEKRTNGDIEVRLVNFQLAMRQEQYVKAEAILNSLKSDSDHLMEVEIAKVDLLITQNKFNEAINNLYGLIDTCPQNIVPIKYLASLLEEYRQDECLKMLEGTLKNSKNPAMKRQLGLLLTQYFYKHNRDEDAYKLLNALAVELPFDIPVRRYLLQTSFIKKDRELSQQIVNDIKSSEGEDGWQWKYEQAILWFDDQNFNKKYPEILSLLQNNLKANPADQASRLLLAQTYEKGGDSQLALESFRQAMDMSPQDISVIVPTIAGMYKANQFEEADSILNKLSKQNLSNPEISKLHLKSYLRRGDLNSAEIILEDLMANDPNNNNAVSLSLALLKIRQNKFQRANELLDSLKSKNQESLDISAAMVELYLAQNINDKALNICNDLIAKFDNASSYIIRGKTYCRIGQSTQAQKDFDRAIELEPENANVWIARSYFYQLTGLRQNALEDMQQALKLEPKNLHIIKCNIDVLLCSGQPDKINQGQELLANASNLNPGDIELELYKAQYLLAESTSSADRQAQKILEKITEQHPTNSDAWELLAKIYLKHSQLSMAMDVVLQGLVYSPDDNDLLLVKAQIEAAHSPELAIPTLKILHDRQPNDFYIISTLAKIYTAMGRSDRAVTFLKSILDNNNSQIDRTKIRLELAIVMYKNGDKIQAIQQFDSLYKDSTDAAKVFLTEVNLLIEDQQWDMLNQRINNALPEKTDKIALLITVADNLIVTQTDEGSKIAEKLLNEIIDRDPDNANAMSSMGILLQNKSQFDVAEKYYEKILKIQPDNLIAINNLAWIFSQRPSQLQRALQLAHKGLQKSPNFIDLIDTRGCIYYQLGQNEKAVTDFTKCIEMYPENSPLLAASYFHLAKSLIKLGQNQKAVENLQMTLSLNTKLGGLSTFEITEAEHLLAKFTGKNAHATNTK